MDVLRQEHEGLVQKANLGKSVEDVQKTIDLLIKARESIATSMYFVSRSRTSFQIPYSKLTLLDPGSASITLAKLQNPVKQSFEAIKDDLQDVYNALGKYEKALDKVRWTAPAFAPTADIPSSPRNSRTSHSQPWNTMHCRPTQH